MLSSSSGFQADLCCFWRAWLLPPPVSCPQWKRVRLQWKAPALHPQLRNHPHLRILLHPTGPLIIININEHYIILIKPQSLFRIDEGTYIGEHSQYSCVLHWCSNRIHPTHNPWSMRLIHCQMSHWASHMVWLIDYFYNLKSIHNQCRNWIKIEIC